MEKRIAILLVFYNEEHFIPDLLNSIKRQTYKNIKIFALDNGSTDNSYLIAKDIIPGINIEKSDINYGFAVANNKLALSALEEGSELLFILNTDMLLDENCIYQLVDLIESDPLIGAVSPIVLFSRNNEKTNIIQSYVDRANFFQCKTYSIQNNLNINEISTPDKCLVNIIHGGAFLVKKELIKKIGLFYEPFYMYQDEIDFAYRAKNTEFTMYVTKKAISWHLHDWSQRNKKGYYLEYYYTNRNKILFLKKSKLLIYLIIELIKEFFLFPSKFLWAYRTAGLKLIKYYYLGFIDGISNKAGKRDKEFI